MSISTAAGLTEFRAGATDLSERRRSGISQAALIDLAPSPDTAGIAWGADGAASIGAFTHIEALATDPRIARAYPALAAAAGGLATPQVRHLATLGGNLAQRSRCWYYRNPHFTCLKRGGDECPSRDGNHLYGVAFDLGPCVSPHPSTLAAALLAYDATVATDRRVLTIPDLLGDGSNGQVDHALEPGEIIKRVQLPAPLDSERGFYKRAIARSYAEWPLAEIVVRATVSNGLFQFVRVTAGGVAPIPLRLVAVERAAEGRPADAATAADAALRAANGAKPLPMTGYKLELLKGLVADLLSQSTLG
jgi:xanthine dehydrogenase YagS FAD-binding subunit